MSTFGKIKCYLSSALFFWAIYHIAITCPLCKPLAYDNNNNNTDKLCLYSHQGYSIIKPYTDPITLPLIEYYNDSPVKPYVDDSIVILQENYIKHIDPLIQESYDFIIEKLYQLKERLDNDELSNVKKIVIPDNDNLDAFIGTPNPNQEKIVDPVFPQEDIVDPTPEVTTKVTNVIPTTKYNEDEEEEGKETSTIVSVASEGEEIEPIAAETNIPETEEIDNNNDNSNEEDSKLEKIVHEVEDIVKNIVAEEIIEAAEAIAQQI
jgi:hypothetical protein